YQPDDADWDAEDVRYATVRWSTGEADFAGLGPVRADPRTGQIFDADVLINGESLRDYGTYVRLSQSLPHPAPAMPPARGMPFPACTLAREMAGQVGLGLVALEQSGEPPAGSAASQEFLEAAVKAMVMHEIGHALGLRHNFKGSAAT